jgi:hypothetical protein
MKDKKTRFDFRFIIGDPRHLRQPDLKTIAGAPYLPRSFSFRQPANSPTPRSGANSPHLTKPK